MSRYSGAQGKGAARRDRDAKKREALARGAATSFAAAALLIAPDAETPTYDALALVHDIDPAAELRPAQQQEAVTA